VRTRLDFTCNTSSCVHPPFVYRDKFFFPGVVIFIQFDVHSSCMCMENGTKHLAYGDRITESLCI